MSDTATSASAPRRVRVDAARNRAAILLAAREALTADGPDASLEAVARAAGVGIGTLYRNFPTREDLVAAVYGNELDVVLATAAPLLAAHAPDVALREFMRNYAGFIATKRGLAESLRAGGARTEAASSHTRERVNAVIGTFLTAGAEQGVLRGDHSADDVTAAMIGVFLATSRTPDDAQAGRLLDLLVQGLRTGSEG